MKKTLMLCVAMVAMPTMMQSCFPVPCDGRIVMYPTTEPVSDSIVIDSTAIVTSVILQLSGHLSDTMFLTISDCNTRPWHDTLIGHVEMKHGPYDWYDNKLFVQYYTKGVSDGDSVVLTCWF